MKLNIGEFSLINENTYLQVKELKRTNTIEKIFESKEEVGINILVVDDEKLVRDTIKRYIKRISKETKSNFNIYESSNCFEALNLIYERISHNERINILIIDEYMPFMRGSSLICLLKQLSEENSILTMEKISHTAFDTFDKKNMILTKGADHVLNKPVEFDHFKNLLLGLKV